jgi:hypothetical protein
LFYSDFTSKLVTWISQRFRHICGCARWLWAQQLSLDVPAYAGFLCDKAAVFRDKIKWTNFIKKNLQCFSSLCGWINDMLFNEIKKNLMKLQSTDSTICLVWWWMLD